MLNKAFDKNDKLVGLIFHSDQGWQYQHESYQQRLKNKGIKQSMSRKGNCFDNCIIESFFGHMKNVSPNVKKVFEMAGVTKIIPIIEEQGGTEIGKCI